jgi:hypothetical protein
MFLTLITSSKLDNLNFIEGIKVWPPDKKADFFEAVLTASFTFFAS